MAKLNKNDKLVLEVLKDGELTLQEIADKTGITSKKIFKILRKLFEKELIDTKARKYELIEKQWREPRAGLDPAACCLQGSRSTRLSYRGTHHNTSTPNK